MQSKIYFTHGLNRTVPRVATQFPDSSSQGSGTSWNYRTTFQRRTNGQVVASVLVKTVVDFRNYDGDPYGVVTSYCDGMTVCPTWVNSVVG